MIGPGALPDDSPCGLLIHEFLALLQTVERFRRLAKLSQYPGGGRDRPWKMKRYVARTSYLDPAFNQGVCLRPSTHQGVQRACGEVSSTDCERMLHRLGEADRFHFLFG